MLQGTIFS